LKHTSNTGAFSIITLNISIISINIFKSDKSIQINTKVRSCLDLIKKVLEVIPIAYEDDELLDKATEIKDRYASRKKLVNIKIKLAKY
jgi:hypothetical protein